MTLRDLNWRKGCFRLWLFLSCIWIIGVASMAGIPAAMRYFESLKAAQELNACKFIRSEPRNTEVPNPFDDIVNEPLINLERATVPGFIAVDRLTGNRLTAEEFLDRPDSQMEYVQAGTCYDVNRVAKSVDSRKKELLVYSGWTFLPPIIVLILGTSFIWVLSGFAPRQGT
jgi:hypothetical protein